MPLNSKYTPSTLSSKENHDVSGWSLIIATFRTKRKRSKCGTERDWLTEAQHIHMTKLQLPRSCFRSAFLAQEGVQCTSRLHSCAERDPPPRDPFQRKATHTHTHTDLAGDFPGSPVETLGAPGIGSLGSVRGQEIRCHD